MSKLTEIKESIPVAEKFIEQNIMLKQLGLDGFTKEVFEDMRYLISLLEEKNKALEEIMNIYEGDGEHVQVARKMWQTANEALNTSSSSKGEM